MNDARRLSIPVILGTPCQGRLSEFVAGVVLEELHKRDGVHTTRIDTNLKEYTHKPVGRCGVSVVGGVLEEVHRCPACGKVELRHATPSTDGFDYARTAGGRLPSRGGPS